MQQAKIVEFIIILQSGYDDDKQWDPKEEKIIKMGTDLGLLQSEKNNSSPPPHIRFENYPLIH